MRCRFINRVAAALMRVVRPRMKRLLAIILALGPGAGVALAAKAAQLTGRLGGRDVEITDATVEGASQVPVSAQSLPPNGYSGVELLRSTERDLFAKFPHTSRSRLIAGGAEVDEGYCYSSSDGSYVSFSLAAFSQFNAIQLSRKPLGDACAPASTRLEKCLGVFCLGQTRAEVERQLGIELGGEIASDRELEVAYYHYKVPMSSSERKKFEDFNLSEVPVDHNLWFKFDSEGLYYIGIWRREDLP